MTLQAECLQENLNKGLAMVARGAASNPTLPITANVLIAADGSRLRLSATDLETTITAWIGGRVETEGAITVPAKQFAAMMKGLPKALVNLSANKTTLDVTCGAAKFHINGDAATDYPPTPVLKEAMTFAVGAQALHKAITHVLFAASGDKARPVLTGVNASFKENTLTLAGADGYRLAVYTLVNPCLPSESAFEASVTIPGRAMRELSRLVAKEKERVSIEVDSRLIRFTGTNWELTAYLETGTYPNYGQLIPTQHTARVRVNAPDFLAAVKTVYETVRQGSGIVKLETKGNNLIISARADDDVVEVEVVANWEHEATKIAFNGRYLADVLAVAGDATVALETTALSAPGVIRIEGLDNYSYTVMPMFVQW